MDGGNSGLGCVKQTSHDCAHAMKDAENQFHSAASFGHDDGTSRRTWPRLAGMLLLAILVSELSAGPGDASNFEAAFFC